jgi:ubiquinone/menaquinone biosynthesis C-methylase UbiE
MNDNWKQLNNNLYVERSIQYSIYPGYPKIEFANKLFINSEHKGTNNFDKLIQKIGKTDCKILDLACGSGEFIELLINNLLANSILG